MNNKQEQHTESNIMRTPCAEHQDTVVCLATLAQKLEIFSLSIETFTKTVSELSSVKADRVQIHDDLAVVSGDIREMKTSLQQILITMERNAAEHDMFMKDITYLSNITKELGNDNLKLQNLIDERERESLRFRTEIKTYMKVAVGIACAAPFITSAVSWLGQLLTVLK